MKGVLLPNRSSLLVAFYLLWKVPEYEAAEEHTRMEVDGPIAEIGGVQVTALLNDGPVGLESL